MRIVNLEKFKALTEEELAGLVELNLSYNQIDDVGAVALAERFASLGKLRGLYLHDNQIDPKGAAALAGRLPSLGELRALDLSYNQIDDVGATAIAERLPSLGNLRKLYLAYNQIGAVGAVALAEGLASLGELRMLSLHNNQIGDKGAVALAEGLASASLGELRMLSLHNNQITTDLEAKIDRFIKTRYETHLGLFSKFDSSSFDTRYVARDPDAPLTRLPDELLACILSKLPPKDLIRTACSTMRLRDVALIPFVTKQVLREKRLFGEDPLRGVFRVAKYG